MAPRKEGINMARGGEAIGPCLADIKWNGVSLAIAVLIYKAMWPADVSGWGWAAGVLARNLSMMFAFFGLFHWALYVKRAATASSKFNPSFPEAAQHRRDFLLTTLSLGINSAFECSVVASPSCPPAGGHGPIICHQVLAVASGLTPSYPDFWQYAQYPLWSLAWLVASPFWREIHFFVYHWLLHVEPFYRHASFSP
eukprot:gene2613-531_t